MLHHVCAALDVPRAYLPLRHENDQQDVRRLRNMLSVCRDNVEHG